MSHTIWVIFGTSAQEAPGPCGNIKIIANTIRELIWTRPNGIYQCPPRLPAISSPHYGAPIPAYCHPQSTPALLVGINSLRHYPLPISALSALVSALAARPPERRQMILTLLRSNGYVFFRSVFVWCLHERAVNKQPTWHAAAQLFALHELFQFFGPACEERIHKFVIRQVSIWKGIGTFCWRVRWSAFERRFERMRNLEFKLWVWRFQRLERFISRKLVFNLLILRCLEVLLPPESLRSKLYSRKFVL